MTKMLRVTMPDGSVWDVPAALVAEPRARYYAQVDIGGLASGVTSGPEFDAAYQDELTTADDSDLVDWAQNNMNWSDVKHAARNVIGLPVVDYQEGWVNGEMVVVDVP